MTRAQLALYQTGCAASPPGGMIGYLLRNSWKGTITACCSFRAACSRRFDANWRRSKAMARLPCGHSSSARTEAGIRDYQWEPGQRLLLPIPINKGTRAVLAQAGLSLDSIPEAGQIV